MLPWKILWLRMEVNTRTPLTSILTEMVTVFFPFIIENDEVVSVEYALPEDDLEG